jgi:two-component system sensor histidine kinase KdpD
MIGDLEVIARRVIEKDGVRHEELDRDAVLARRPEVVLIDELAHTNAPGSFARKRYEDVLAILRAGIDVITTLNIQHLEALNDTVYRMTQTHVRETLPDGLLALADEVILIDVTPETLRQRLREGRIYPRERIERALSSFFTLDNLASLRELALREAMRARKRERPRAPFERLLLCVGPRDADVALILRCSQFAARLGADFAVAKILEPRDACSHELTTALREEAQKHCAEWIEEVAADPARRIIELARMVPETTVALAATLRKPRWPQRNAFARRVLDAGARELLVLTRR